MVLYNRTRRIGSMLLFVVCAMFTVHTASAEEIISPVPYPANAAPTEHEALTSEMEGIELVHYNITLAEMLPVVRERGFKGNVADAMVGLLGLMRRAANAPPPLSDADKDAMRSLTKLETGNENEKDNGFIIFSGSNDAVRIFIRELESRNRMSILTRPHVVCAIGTPALIVVGGKAPQHEMELLPVRLEDGKLTTKIVVKRTETIDDKEETHQWETSVNLPTNNETLVVSHKLGDNEVVLFISAQLRQHMVPMAVARSIYCPQ